jgi:hypothetical protein
VWTLAGSVAGVAAATAAAWGALGTARVSRRNEAEERQRLSNEVFGRSPAVKQFLDLPSIEVPPRGTRRQPPPALPPDQVPPSDQVPPPDQVPQTDQADEYEEYEEYGEPLGPKTQLLDEPAASRDAAYDQLLIDDYALGFTQARRAFNVSMFFSILGGIVLIVGVGLAIFRAETGGQVAAAAITSAAGVLTSGLSQLFRGQSTKALKHLESQATELRKDVRAQNNVAKALRLLEDVLDLGLRSRLQAALILEFTGAKLPDLGRPFDTQQATFDGRAHNSVSTEPAAPSSR